METTTFNRLTFGAAKPHALNPDNPKSRKSQTDHLRFRNVKLYSVRVYHVAAD